MEYGSICHRLIYRVVKVPISIQYNQRITSLHDVVIHHEWIGNGSVCINSITSSKSRLNELNVFAVGEMINWTGICITSTPEAIEFFDYNWSVVSNSH